jgi:hypothetical protein
MIASTPHLRGCLCHACRFPSSVPKDTAVAAPVTVPAPQPKAKRKRPPSRPQRWAEACSAAVAALEELTELQGEYNDWLGNLNEGGTNSPMGEKLQAIESLDLQTALETAQEAEGLDLPRGFGKD